MANWRLAKSLTRLRDQINQTAPTRSKVSDGSIGDPAHSARASDHNPNSQGIVTAIDITHDPEHGVDGHILSHVLTLDSRVKYVIFWGHIWKARTGKWENYTGPNAHKHHVHVSVKAEFADMAPAWVLEPPVLPNPQTPEATKPLLKFGSKGQEVRILQERMRAKGYPVSIDGTFGLITEGNVRKFQVASGLKDDGIVGSDTWAALNWKESN